MFPISGLYSNICSCYPSYGSLKPYILYDMTAPRVKHQDILLELAFELKKCSDTSEKGYIVRIAPIDVRLLPDDRNMFQPDILVTCDESRNTDDYYDGAPEMTVEILSPSSRRKDFIIKSNSYQKAGVKEYWIVDPDKQQVWVYFFAEDTLPTVYSFNDKIPVNISGGKCAIDFSKISAAVSL